MSRGRMDKSGILTFRPRVVSVIRRKVAEGHQQEKEKDTCVSNFEAISGLEDDTDNSRMVGNKKKELRESRKVGINLNRKVVIVETKVFTEEKPTNKKFLENEKIQLEFNSKKETGVPEANQIKNCSSELSKEDTDFIYRRGGRVERKIWQITGFRFTIAKYGQGSARYFIRGSEGAVMEVKSIIQKEEAFLQEQQVLFLLQDSGKRMRKLEKNSQALIILRGRIGDQLRPVTFIGTELAKTTAKAILQEAVIIQTKNLLDVEVDILLGGCGKLIKRIQKEAEVGVEIKGKRGDKGRATDVIGSKEAIAKAWALIQKALNKP